MKEFLTYGIDKNLEQELITTIRAAVANWNDGLELGFDIFKPTEDTPDVLIQLSNDEAIRAGIILEAETKGEAIDQAGIESYVQMVKKEMGVIVLPTSRKQTGILIVDEDEWQDEMMVNLGTALGLPELDSEGVMNPETGSNEVTGVERDAISRLIKTGNLGSNPSLNEELLLELLHPYLTEFEGEEEADE